MKVNKMIIKILLKRNKKNDNKKIKIKLKVFQIKSLISKDKIIYNNKTHKKIFKMTIINNKIKKNYPRQILLFFLMKFNNKKPQ